MKSVGLRIKEARLAKNMKQDELAEHIGAKSAAAVWQRSQLKSCTAVRNTIS